MTQDPRDLTLCELVQDPMTQAVMRADGLDQAAFTATLCSVRRQITDKTPRRVPSFALAASQTGQTSLSICRAV